MADQTLIQVTTEEFETFINERPDRHYELIHGEIVEKVVTEEHGYIALNIGAEIRSYLKQHPIGRASVETRYKPIGDNLNARLPDVSFRRTNEALVKRGPIPGMPDLAVEIKSPDDTNQQMRDTAAYYLEHGCAMVWVIYPAQRMVEVYQATADIQILLEKDSIDGGTVLPGFQMAVATIFD